MSTESGVLDQDIRDFLSQYIDSVGTLEILLYLRKERATAWHPERLAFELRGNLQATEMRAQKLCRDGLLKITAENVTYQYRPQSDVTDALVERIQELYPKFQSRLIDQIYRSRRLAIADFADAFKLKKEKS